MLLYNIALQIKKNAQLLTEDFFFFLATDRMNAAAFEPTALSQPSPTGPKESGKSLPCLIS